MPEAEGQSAADKIRTEQDRIDKIDGKLDSTVKGKDSEETKTLTDAYIRKVDDFRGRIRTARTRVDAEKDMQSPLWMGLEKAANTADRKLADLLSQCEETDIRSLPKAREFTDKVDRFLNEFTAEQRVNASPEKTPVDAQRAEIDASLRRLGANDAVRTRVTTEGLKHYGSAQLLGALARLELLQKIPAGAQREIFDGFSFDKTLVFNQLCNGTLDANVAAALLTQQPEERIRQKREMMERTVRKFDEEIRDLMRGQTNDLREANKRTAKKEKETDVDSAVNSVKMFQSCIAKKQEESAPYRQELARLQLALATFDASQLRGTGQEQLANRMLMKSREIAGRETGLSADQLRALDPSAAKQTDDALGELRKKQQLSDFEKKLYGEKPDLPGALKTSVERQRSIDPRTDYLDQIESRKALRLEDAIPSALFKQKAFGAADYTIVPPEFNDPALVFGRISFADGRSIRAVLSSDAKRALDALPAGASPIILTNLDEPLAFDTSGFGPARVRSGRILTTKDFGYATRDGRIFRADGKEFTPSSPSENKAVQEQVRRQRSFFLRQSGDTWTLRTASGREIHNVRVSKDALEIIGKDDPENNTLTIDPTIELADGMRLDANALRYASVQNGELIIRQSQGTVRIRQNAKEMQKERASAWIPGGQNAEALKLTPDQESQYRNQLSKRSCVKIGTIVEADGSPDVPAEVRRFITQPKASLYATTLLMPNGSTYDVTLTPDAKNALESIPAGNGIVMLKNQEPTVTFGRNRSVPLQASDIGYVGPNGNIVTAGSSARVDVSKEPNRTGIESQLEYRRSFFVQAENDPFRKIWTVHTGDGKACRGVMISQAAIDYINAADTAEDGTLMIDPGLELRSGMTLTLAHLRYAKEEDGGKLTVRPVSSNTEVAESMGRLPKAYTVNEVLSRTSTEGLRRESGEKSGDVLRAIDASPDIRNIRGIAATMQRPMQELQEMLAAGTQGTKRESFVAFARDKAQPLLTMLDSPQTAQSLQDAKAQLEILKTARLGIASGTEDAKISQQIEALSGMVELLEGGSTREVLEAIVKNAAFDADTWAKWFANDAPKYLISIAAAVAAAALVAATCGAATPLVLFLATTGAATVGGTVGAQLGSEAVYYGRNLLDGDVRGGNKYFRERSLLGQYLTTGKMVDPGTGLEVPMEFIKDIASPVLQELALSFALNCASMGLGKLSGEFIATYVSKATGKAVDDAAAQALSRQIATVRASYDQLAAVGLGKAGKSFVERALETSLHLAKETAKGTTIGALDAGVGAGLDQADHRLGFVYNVFRIGTSSYMAKRLQLGVEAKVRLKEAVVDGDALRVPCEGDRKPVIEALRTELERNGYGGVTADADGLTVTLSGGDKFRIALDQAPASEATGVKVKKGSTTETTPEKKAPSPAPNTAPAKGAVETAPRRPSVDVRKPSETVQVGEFTVPVHDLYPELKIESRADLEHFLENYRKIWIQTLESKGMYDQTNCGPTSLHLLRALYPKEAIVGISDTQVHRLTSPNKTLFTLLEGIGQRENLSHECVLELLKHSLQPYRFQGGKLSIQEVESVLKDPIAMKKAVEDFCTEYPALKGRKELFDSVQTDLLKAIEGKDVREVKDFISSMDSGWGHTVVEVLLKGPDGKIQHLMIDANAEQYGDKHDRLYVCDWDRALSDGGGIITGDSRVVSKGKPIKNIALNQDSSWSYAVPSENLAQSVADNFKNSARRKEGGPRNGVTLREQGCTLAEAAANDPSKIADLKNFLKTNAVDDATRIDIAKALVKTLSAEEATAVLEAHKLPGAIDEGNFDKNTAKARLLLKAFAPGDPRVRLLLDAGVCGEAAVLEGPAGAVKPKTARLKRPGAAKEEESKPNSRKPVRETILTQTEEIRALESVPSKKGVTLKASSDAAAEYRAGKSTDRDVWAERGNHPQIDNAIASREQLSSNLRKVRANAEQAGDAATVQECNKAIAENQDRLGELRFYRQHADYIKAGAEVADILTEKEMNALYSMGNDWINPHKENAPVVLYKAKYSPDTHEAFDTVRGFTTFQEWRQGLLESVRHGSWAFPGGGRTHKDTYLRREVAADVAAAPQAMRGVHAVNDRGVAQNSFEYWERKTFVTPENPERYFYMSRIGDLHADSTGQVRTVSGKVYATETQNAGRLQVYSPTKVKLRTGGTTSEVSQPFHGEEYSIRLVKSAGEVPVPGHERDALELQKKIADDIFDAKRSGKIDAAECQKRIENMGQEISQKEAELLGLVLGKERAEQLHGPDTETRRREISYLTPEERSTVLQIKKSLNELRVELKDMRASGVGTKAEAKTKAPDAEKPLQKSPTALGAQPVNTALDTQRGVQLLEQNPSAENVTASFTLRGTHRQTGEERTATFDVKYIRRASFKPGEAVDIKVTSPDDPRVRIEVSLNPDTKFATVGGNSEMGKLEGYRYYSQIMEKVLGHADQTVNPVNNKQTDRLVRSQGNPETIPHSMIGADSPVGASRKGFIVFLDATGTEITAVRVKPELSRLLDLAVQRERCSTKEEVQAFEKKHPEARADALADAMEANRGELPVNASNALDNQIAHLRQSN